MSFIEITIGGKGVGLADQASIEPAKGCTNNCLGCYAAKTTRMGEKFYKEVTPKEYRDDVFRRSCKTARNKGIKFVRMAKHCDPGHPSVRRGVIQTLQASAEEGLQIVFVSKTLEYNKDVSKALKDGNHILHISLGMKSKIENKPLISNSARALVAGKYKRSGVNTFLRAVYDVTKDVPLEIRGLNNVIVTPLRFSSKEHLSAYNANPDLYEWKDGYYRPKMSHPSWMFFNKWCGEVGDKIMCCNCGGC